MGSNLDHAKGGNIVVFDHHIDHSKQWEEWFVQQIFSPVWHIGFKNYTQNHWKSTLMHVTSCTTTELSFKNINAPDILTRIIHIQFDALTQLKLNNLYLITLQPLVHLNAPHLEGLELSLNHFHSLKSLRKMHAPNLKRLELYENALVEAEYLSECKFSPQMSSIILFNAKTKTLPENYNWIFKIQSQALGYFEYYNTQIIRNENRKQMLKRKYPSIEVKLRFDALET